MNRNIVLLIIVVLLIVVMFLFKINNVREQKKIDKDYEEMIIRSWDKKIGDLTNKRWQSEIYNSTTWFIP